MAACAKCGAELLKTAKFCPQCGASTPASEIQIEKQTTCLKCGAALTENAKFCMECGTPVPDIPNYEEDMPKLVAEAYELMKKKEEEYYAAEDFDAIANVV